ERLPDDLETQPRLVVRALGRRRAVGWDRRGPRDVHRLPEHHRAREAHLPLVRGMARDQAPLHSLSIPARRGRDPPGQLDSPPLRALDQIDSWEVPFVAAGVTRADATVASRGDATRRVRLASVSKPVTALATLVAAEEGVLDLDEPAGPPGATVRHLLAHTSGLPFEGTEPIARPGQRRIYSNEAYRVLGERLATRAEMPFAD